MVKMTVDAENVALQVQHVSLVILAVCLLFGNVEVEGCPLLQVLHLLLEGIKGYAETRNKLERFLGRCFLHHLQSIVAVNIQFVGNGHHFIDFLLIHILALSFVWTAKVYIIKEISKLSFYLFTFLPFYPTESPLL